MYEIYARVFFGGRAPESVHLSGPWGWGEPV